MNGVGLESGADVNVVKDNLIHLLDYACAIHVIHAKVISDYMRAPVLSPITGHDMSRYENVLMHEDAPGDSWIAIERVERTAPPTPPEAIQPFLKGVVLDNLQEPPVARKVAAICCSIEDASDLGEAGLALIEDMRPPKDPTASNAGLVDVLWKLENCRDAHDAFATWITDHWHPWAELERVREQQIKLYRHYFKIYQELRQHSDDYELVLAQNIVVAKAEDGHLVRAPLIEQVIDISLDDQKGYALLITPRDIPPRIMTEPFSQAELPGASKIRSSLSDIIRLRDADPNAVALPFDKAFIERAAMATAAVVHPDAIADTETTVLPQASDKPVCTGLWLLALRPKSLQPYIENIKALTDEIRHTDAQDLPKVGISFGSEPQDVRIGGDDDEDFFDLSNLTLQLSQFNSSGTTPSVDTQPRGRQDDIERFFPLPFNQEQASILELIERSNAVSVQGPPGTGKSHTIANIVAHYMATGRRVLISAKTPEALAGVRSKLPETLSRLTISVLDTDAEGKNQVEQAIRYIASEAQGLNVKATRDEIQRLQQDIVGKRGRIAKIETALHEHASLQLSKVPFGKEGLTPAELVKVIQTDRGAYAWFPDTLGLEENYQPRFDNNIVTELRELRIELGELILYAGTPIPRAQDLPDVPALKRIHERLQQGQHIAEALESGSLPEPAENMEGFESCMLKTGQRFDEVSSIRAHLRQYPDMTSAIVRWFSPGTVETERTEISVLFQSALDWLDLAEQLLVYSINTDEFDWQDKDVLEAIHQAAAGKKPFGLSGLFKSGAKKAFSEIRIRGQVPESREDWQCIEQMMQCRAQAQKLFAHWNGIAGFFNLPLLPETPIAAVSTLRTHRPALKAVGIQPQDWLETLQNLQLLYPYGIDHDAVPEMGKEFERAHNAIRQWINHYELRDAIEVPDRLLALAKQGRGAAFTQLMQLVYRLGKDEPTDTLGDDWRALREDFAVLRRSTPQLERLTELVTLIRESGATKWGALLLKEPVTGAEDALTPSTWRQAWEYARAIGFINSLPSRERINELAAEQASLEADIQRQFNRLIELRTLLGLRRNMTERIASALARFATAFNKIGKNIAGKRSRQHWKEARDAMQDCYDAIPCWIIPEGRVAEQIPAKLKAFDLVIIDEASQSDVTSIPIILRGEKLLVVGDDRQVSPSVAGIKEERIARLMDELLGDHPLKRSFHPTNSLYDLVGIMSPGKRISLREHFRCVEPIINFCSKHFYSEPLIPLRVPDASEQLDPPLIDILVKDGVKQVDINVREAEVIVEEIEQITQDPALENRSIGVISLIGFKQAERISKMLVDRLGVETYERHNLLCGDPRFFQGQERDIVFLSMVSSPGDARSQTGRDWQQKFNVAVSRARDRLVLVRSVELENLSNPEDLKGLLIEHFRRPIEVTDADRSLIDLCQSEFERQVFRRLCDDSYRVIPQFSVGHYAIDLVVEGANDRRLAIELDGDSYHGPDRFAADQQRQKRLERVGWIFWRCWASNWYLDADGCYADLKSALAEQGVEPIGSEYVQAQLVRHKVLGETETSTDIVEELEHIEVSQKDLTVNVTPVELAASVTTESAKTTVTEAAQDTLFDKQDSLTESLIVEPGDLVVLVYDDEPSHEVGLYISEHHDDPDHRIVHVSKPLPTALLGAMIDDEVEVITDRKRLARVKDIEKAALITYVQQKHLQDSPSLREIH